jgi:hypothetical protein
MRHRVVRALVLAIAAGPGGRIAAANAQTPSVTVSGVGYVNYGYSLLADSSLVPPGHDNNFDVSRSYINVIGKFSGGVTTRITADEDGRNASGNQLSFRLKFAYVAWQPNGTGPLTFRMGLTQTPWVDFEETIWDYRMQGAIAVDRNKMVIPSDFGAAVDGSWHGDAINLQAGVYNGEGFNAALGGPAKDGEVRVSVRLATTDLPGRVGGLRLTAYVGVGEANGGGARRRYIGMISYKTKALALAAELVAGQDSTGGLTPHQNSQLITIFGVYNIPRSKVAVIGRLDSYDPATDTTSAALNSVNNLSVNRQVRAIAGISYAISPNLRVLLDTDLNALQNGGTNTFDRNRQMVYFATEFKF